MEHVRVIFFFFACVLKIVPFICLAQKDKYEFPPGFNCVASGGNFTANSSFADSSGERAYAIGLCRREVKRDDCLSCIQIAARNLIEQCPLTNQAVVWYTHCMFRYSNMIIYGRKETTPTLSFQAGKNISANRDEFDRLQIELLDRLKGIAAAGGPNRKYAQGSGSGVAGYPQFYGSAHCTPDLSEQDCNDCLVFGFEKIPGCCAGQVGLRWFFPSCSYRFETWRFYEFDADLEPDPPAIQPADSPTSAARTERTGKGKGGSKVIVAIVIPIVFVALFAICLCLLLKWKKNKSVGRVKGSNAEDEFSDSLVVDFETLKAATDNFSPENELGRGGFGSVYKGVFSGGQEIAVKRLSCTSGQGDSEFKNEILLLAKLQHRNLVRLLGFCIEGQERILVYEFIKNASLDNFIFGNCFPPFSPYDDPTVLFFLLCVDLYAVTDLKKRQLLDWGVRYKMIGGVARGLLYLHEDSRYRIIHRDLKASNILLDQEMNPKIADFGLAKLYDTDQTSTHRFTSKIAGTYGYMAPEYAIYGQFSVKTDVFSFGVLVIEIITGKGNNNGRSNDDEEAENLLSWVWRCWREDIILSVIDPSLTTGSRSEILRCIHIGLLCVQESPASRPTMDSVALMLNSYSYTLPTPSRPAFALESVMPSMNVSSSTEPLLMSLNDVTVSELSPR
ncbi:cysteine-rich RLK (RECEPTOR-like protein kinase) 28 [Arabidopsis thaliana]|uniref:Cysteine-rich RLK (RECEPTOR-like protein kinase) 28 n=2 Tax=Arabidopsis thaliana TaxID=3702 RepID=A0A1P8B5W4_ARATH|nr:cysteine-rich RLK (RECEPTOR-like protein kinase) 28 [Arabidopsis thaliana]ANM66979.1 cysteine-rich RLK (RECEPTOR-like protein kinase) 28 [Arabidopsis thaliana]|eukprot:NP_001328839.1 cysteine-rich RLK (RECEPTOR-like protein kinase) 28 [Arabidopsis thaliana]